MTQEEKHTLLVDLCARLPYDVKVWVKTHDNEIIESDFLTLCNGIGYYSTLSYDGTIESSVVMPYLRPMSSMTNQEIETYRAIIGSLLENSVTYNVPTLYNFLNSKHLDYRGLIPMGLALEAPKDMYDTKTE